MSSYLSAICRRDIPRHLSRLPILEATLSKEALRAIELGAGCGIVSIALSRHSTNLTSLHLTDLPEASSILTHNLSCLPSPKPSHQVLDWSSPLPSNVAETKWDLVLVADCTYNPDVVPDLVQTLGRIADQNQEVLVCLAMKVRHESEMIFFDLMESNGFVVREKCKVPLPVLGDEAQEIVIFVFGYTGR